MRAVVQRVSLAQVTVADQVTGRIGTGLVVLLGVARDDTQTDMCYVADKVCGLRVFNDALGKMNCSLPEVGGQMLVISQFTLLGDCRRGRRPSYIEAAAPELAERLYEQFVAQVRSRGIFVACGQFRQQMEVELVNSGPVTVLIDSRKLF